MADRYWVGGSAAWDSTIGTKWATASGGAGGQSIPTAADNVFLDAASGASNVSVTGTRTCLNLDCTGFTGVLTGTSTPIINVSGTVVTLGTGMSYSIVGPAITLSAAVTCNLTSNGKGMRTINIPTAGCSLVLQDNLTCGPINLTLGTFDANNKNVSCEGLALTGSSARTINMGSGAWAIGNSSAVALWNATTTTLLTYNAGTATISFIPSNSSSYTIVLGSMTITNPITIAARSNPAARIALSGGTINNLTINGGNCVQFASNMTVQLCVINGLANNYVIFESTAVGATRTITTSTSITGRYAIVRDIIKSGAGTMQVGPGINLGGNSGVVFDIGLPQATYGMGI